MIIKTIVTVILYILLAPAAGALLEGAGRRFAAKLAGGSGGSITQPVTDMRKLMEKTDEEGPSAHEYHIRVFLFFMVAAGAAFAAGLDLPLIILLMAAAETFYIIAERMSGAGKAADGEAYGYVRILAVMPAMIFMAAGFSLFCGSMDTGDIMNSAFMPVLPLIGVFAAYVCVCILWPYEDRAAGSYGRTRAMVMVGRWYTVILMMGFVFLFFQTGGLIGYVVGAAAAVAVYLAGVFVRNCNAKVRMQHVFRTAWTVSAILGVVNVFMLYVIS